MLRPASRSLLRQSIPSLRSIPSRRLLSTAPPHEKRRSWKSSALRWGIALGGIYYYNTSSLFAEIPTSQLKEAPAFPTSDEELPTLASLSPSVRLMPPNREDLPSIPPTPTSSSPPSINPKAPAPTQVEPTEQQSDLAIDASSAAAGLEEEAGQQGAFNEETGEINWDCPCLGGMAHGPCGPAFRAAFSCFVYSKEEPKGMDCIENFKGMQDCFRQHPDIYADELDSDDDDGDVDGIDGAVGVGEAETEGKSNVRARREAQSIEVDDVPKDIAQSSVPAHATSSPQTNNQHESVESESHKSVATSLSNAAREPDMPLHEPTSETAELVPKAAHDTAR